MIRLYSLNYRTAGPIITFDPAMDITTADFDQEVIPGRTYSLHDAREDPRVVEEVLTESFTRPMRDQWRA